CRFRGGFLLLPFRMWEERPQRNLPFITRRLKTSPIRNYSEMFCSITKNGNTSPATAKQKKLLIGSFKLVSRSHQKAKLKKAGALRRKWALSWRKASWTSSLQRSAKKFCNV